MLISWLMLAHAVLTAAAAWCVGGPLIEGGQLLHPLRMTLYDWVERHVGPPENVWWWKPVWGCRLCMVGQWCFWMYLFHVCSLRYADGLFHLTYTGYLFYEHVYVVAVGLLTCLFLSKTLD